MGYVCLCGTLCQTVTKIFQLSADEKLWLWVDVCVFVSLCPSSWFVIYLITPSIAHYAQLTSILLGLKQHRWTKRTLKAPKILKGTFFSCWRSLWPVHYMENVTTKVWESTLLGKVKDTTGDILGPRTKTTHVATENSLKTALKTAISEQKQTHTHFHKQVCSVWNIAQVCNFCITSITKCNCKNNDSFQTGYLNTPVCHRLDK